MHTSDPALGVHAGVKLRKRMPAEQAFCLDRQAVNKVADSHWVSHFRSRFGKSAEP